MSCRRCGQCCDHILLSFNTDKDWQSEKDWLTAHEGVHLESEDSDEALVRFDLHCRHLIRAQDGRPAVCEIYSDRPQVCGEYPDSETLDYLDEHPEVTPDCGYRR